MSAFPLTRRAALAALGALVSSSLAEMPAALAQPGLRIRAIKVDVSPIRASMGDPTAAWVEEALPGALAQSLAPYMAPGDRNGATLVARIDYLYLGSRAAAAARAFSANPRHDQRNAPAQRTAGRRRERAAAGDLQLFPDGGRSDAVRAGFAGPGGPPLRRRSLAGRQGNWVSRHFALSGRCALTGRVSPRPALFARWFGSGRASPEGKGQKWSPAP